MLQRLQVPLARHVRVHACVADRCSVHVSCSHCAALAASQAGWSRLRADRRAPVSALGHRLARGSSVAAAVVRQQQRGDNDRSSDGAATAAMAMHGDAAGAAPSSASALVKRWQRATGEPAAEGCNLRAGGRGRAERGRRASRGTGRPRCGGLRQWARQLLRRGSLRRLRLHCRRGEGARSRVHRLHTALGDSCRVAVVTVAASAHAPI